MQSEFSTTLPWSRLLGGSTVAAMANVLREPPDDSGTTVAPAPSPKPATPRRILLRFVRRGPVGLPYPPGFALLNLWVLLPPVRRRFLRKKIEVFRRWLDITGLEGPGRALHQHLVANTWTLWRLESLKTAAARRTWVRARGLEHLDRGTVVVWTHTALRREPVLPFLGPDVYSLLGVRDATGSLAENVLMAERLKTARTTLERGGVVLIAGDGTMGRARFRMPFYDRHLDFRGGFAELALETGAAVVPAFSRLAAGGATTVDFLPPLTPSTADGLVEQFARLYVSWWPRILPFLYSNHLETLLKGWQEARSPGRKHRG